MKSLHALSLASFLFIAFLLIGTAKDLSQKLSETEKKVHEDVALFIAETGKRKAILALLIKEEEQYCDGVPWQEDTVWVNAHWQTLQSIYFADTITLNMLDSFRAGSYFKINEPPMNETPTVERAPSGLSKNTCFKTGETFK